MRLQTEALLTLGFAFGFEHVHQKAIINDNLQSGQKISDFQRSVLVVKHLQGELGERARTLQHDYFNPKMKALSQRVICSVR